MIAGTLEEFAAAVGGTLHNAPSGVRISGEVRTDSREVQAGDLFVALIGEQQDGHRYAAVAAGRRAAALLVAHPVDAPAPQIVVEDTLAALHRLAAWMVGRARSEGALEQVIGITGSAGKTTTKLLLGAILAGVGPTVIPEKSFNNEVGAPVTMLRVTAETQFLVSEMGASHRGDVAALAALCHPTVGVELQVGLAHIGEFGSRDAIRVAKQELVEELPATGTAVLNADDSRVRTMAEHTPARVVWFGRSEDSDVRILDVSRQEARLRVVLRTPDTEQLSVEVGLVGEHNAWNIAAAVAAARAVGVSDAQIAAGLATVHHGERWRMQLMPRPDGVLILNDAYNASPGSMTAALKTLATFRDAAHRSVAVLGAMSELGEASESAHATVGREAVRTGVGLLVVVGESARPIADAAAQQPESGEIVFVSDATEADDYLREALRPGDVVLVKSSNASGLRLLGDRLAGEARA